MAEEDDLTVDPLEEPGLDEQDDGNRAVASSMVASWGYDRQQERLEVFFTRGGFETYDCSPSQWEEAKNAVSPGRFMWDNFL